MAKNADKMAESWGVTLDFDPESGREIAERMESIFFDDSGEALRLFDTAMRVVFSDAPDDSVDKNDIKFILTAYKESASFRSKLKNNYYKNLGDLKTLGNTEPEIIQFPVPPDSGEPALWYGEEGANQGAAIAAAPGENEKDELIDKLILTWPPDLEKGIKGGTLVVRGYSDNNLATVEYIFDEYDPRRPSYYVFYKYDDNKRQSPVLLDNISDVPEYQELIISSSNPDLEIDFSRNPVFYAISRQIKDKL
jgi:hypothetical protein